MRVEFEGKQQIYGHHLTVPISPLVPHKDKSIHVGNGDVEESLIIKGDNLYALKSLLPRFVGRIKCVYIDPPYNTGNENWVYNDRVQSPTMCAWFEQNKPVDGEDMVRHDKWMCMMWPRLQLLRQLLSDDGVIFVSIDDNEQHRLRCLMDEIFGENNFIACLPTVMNLKGNNDEFGFAGTHEYTLCWAKDRTQTTIGEFELDDEDLNEWLVDDIGLYKKGATLKATGINAPREKRPNLYFPIYVGPTDDVQVLDNGQQIPDGYEEILPLTNGKPMSWRWSKEAIARESHNVIVERTSKGITLYKKQRPQIGDIPTRKPKSLFYKPEYSSGNGTAEIKMIFGDKVYDYPKPVKLIQDLIALSTNKDSIVLDSFAGSGTTAHAVLALNSEDGGNRKFILVECEDYADSITAERVRRVIAGVPDANGPKYRRLRQGLGGAFTFFTLGNALNVEDLLNGNSLPTYTEMATWVYYLATGHAIDVSLIDDAGNTPFYRETTTERVRDFWLLYRPDVTWLASDASGFNESIAKQVAKSGRESVVYATHGLVPHRQLIEMDITFCKIPFIDTITA